MSAFGLPDHPREWRVWAQSGRPKLAESGIVGSNLARQAGHGWLPGRGPSVDSRTSFFPFHTIRGLLGLYAYRPRMAVIDQPTSARKLAAILSADIAGYSALMGADEEGTVRKLREVREAVLPLLRSLVAE